MSPGDWIALVTLAVAVIVIVGGWVIGVTVQLTTCCRAVKEICKKVEEVSARDAERHCDVHSNELVEHERRIEKVEGWQTEHERLARA